MKRMTMLVLVGACVTMALFHAACAPESMMGRGGVAKESVTPAQSAIVVEAEGAKIDGKATVVDLGVASGKKVVTSTDTATLTFDVEMTEAGKVTLEIIRFKKPTKVYDYWGYRFWRVNGKAQPIDTDYSMFRPRSDLSFAELEIGDYGGEEGLKRYVVAFIPGLKLKKGANKVVISVPGGVTLDAIRVTPALDLELITVTSAERDFIYFDDQNEAAFTIRLKNNG
ncbi:MAG: hypothetical protein QF662_07565, partial [Phycisphaerae bacterium]|nr:hypothetical protein [Phycisphaerae bacterium]